MRFSPLIFACSITVNAALLVSITVSLSRHTEHATAPSASASQTSVAHETAPDPKAWAGLKTGDLVAQRDRLRTQGFPPEVVRAILTAQIRTSFSARRKALESAQGEIPFWKNPAGDSSTSVALRALAKEERTTLAELLGPDPDSGTAASLRQQFPNLPADKILQLAALRDRYDEQRQEIYATASGGLTPDEQRKISALDPAMRAELAALLTPQELKDYDLHTSNITRLLGNTLAAFDATEQEFRGLFQLRQAFEEKYPAGFLPPEEAKARSAASGKLNEDIQTLFGPERYANYQRATDGNYQQISKLVARLELPTETTNQVYALQQDFQSRTTALQTKRALAPEDRNAQLAALAAEARAKVTATLGPRGYEAYKQYGGSWLQDLQPRTVAPPRN